MANTTIAKRYAMALVQIGSEDGQLDLLRDELAGIESVFTANSDLLAPFSNPSFTLLQRREIMNSLVKASACSVVFSNFLLLLVDKNRGALLTEIVRAFEGMADEQSGVIRPLVRSAMPLDDAQISSIRVAMEKWSNKNVLPKFELDPALIGGVVVQIGDTAFDSSVKTQLDRIQDILQKG